jgi:hypothetical protein
MDRTPALLRTATSMLEAYYELRTFRYFDLFQTKGNFNEKTDGDSATKALGPWFPELRQGLISIN